MIIKGTYAASNFFLRQGIEVDLNKRCYIKFRKVFSFIRFADGCQRLPKGDYLLLFRTLYVKCEACTEDDFNNSSIIQLSIVYNKNRRLIVHESSNLPQMIEFARDLSRALSLKVRDSATNRRQPTWLK